MPAKQGKTSLPTKQKSEVFGKEAPREKLIRLGAKSLSDEELLAIFLRVGYKGKNVMQLSKEIIETKGFKWLISTDRKSYLAVSGLGDSSYVQLRAVMELGRRYLDETIRRESDSFSSATKMKSYLCHRFGDSERELFCCLFMDSKNRLIEFKEIFAGTIDVANVYPREIIKHALKVNAASLVLAHNHPSGELQPSQADKKITKEIAKACELMEIRLLDHIIVSGTSSLSFMEEGLLESHDA